MTDERKYTFSGPPVKHRLTPANSLRVSLLLLVLSTIAHQAHAQASGTGRATEDDRWSAVSAAIGGPGRSQPDGAYTVAFLRGDFGACRPFLRQYTVSTKLRRRLKGAASYVPTRAV